MLTIAYEACFCQWKLIWYRTFSVTLCILIAIFLHEAIYITYHHENVVLKCRKPVTWVSLSA